MRTVFVWKVNVRFDLGQNYWGGRAHDPSAAPPPPQYTHFYMLAVYYQLQIDYRLHDVTSNLKQKQSLKPSPPYEVMLTCCTRAQLSNKMSC